VAREPAREQPARVLLDIGVGIAHEVDALLPVAVLDGEADAVEREADTAPYPVEGLQHLQRLAALDALLDRRTLLLRGGGGGDDGARLLLLGAEAHHQTPQELGLELR